MTTYNKYHKKYEQSLKGKETRKKYYNENREILLKRTLKYQQSNIGKINRKKYNAIHNPINKLKNTGHVIMENCAICNSPNTEFHHPNNNLPLHIYFLCKECHDNQHGGY
jgi:hypothetical protein